MMARTLCALVLIGVTSMIGNSQETASEVNIVKTILTGAAAA
jgi:hypothetical protein